MGEGYPRLADTVRKLHYYPVPGANVAYYLLMYGVEFRRVNARRAVPEFLSNLSRPLNEAEFWHDVKKRVEEYADALLDALKPVGANDETAVLASSHPLGPVVPARQSYFSGRLCFEDEACTVYLDSTAFCVNHAAAYKAFHFIAQGAGQHGETKTLKSQVLGCSGRLDSMLKKHLPPELLQVLSGRPGHGGGYSIVLSPR
jgi:hypothetical protein